MISEASQQAIEGPGCHSSGMKIPDIPYQVDLIERPKEMGTNLIKIRCYRVYEPARHSTGAGLCHGPLSHRQMYSNRAP